MSGEIDLDVSDAYRETRKHVEQIVNEKLSTISFSAPYEKWAFIAIIRHRSHPDYREIKKKDAKRRVLEFRLKIDHALFKAANQANREIILIDALERSVGLMEQFDVPLEDREALQSILAEVKEQ